MTRKEPNFNFSDPAAVSSLQDEIKGLIDQMPLDMKVFHLTQLREMLTRQGEIAKDSLEAHLSYMAQSLSVIISNLKGN